MSLRQYLPWLAVACLAVFPVCAVQAAEKPGTIIPKEDAAKAQAEAEEEAPPITQAPAVIELFSATTCPYCPQAQKNFDALTAKYPELIPMVCYIDQTKMYEDPVERPMCGPRLLAYSGRVSNGKDGTPVFLVNGKEMVPNVRTEFEAYIMETVRHSNLKKITITPSQTVKGSYFLDLPQVGRVTGAQSLQLWLAIIRDPVPSKTIPATTKSYTNAIDSFTRFSSWAGTAKRMPITVNPPAGSSKFVILAEDAQKQILAAGQINLP